jgi:hypothetical protein
MSEPIGISSSIPDPMGIGPLARCEDGEGVPAAQRQAAPPPPFLDNGYGNVPREAAERKPWGRKQWLTRRTILDRLRYWQSHGFQCLWVTLTSSRDSSRARLRVNFQVLWKRLARKFGFSGVEYVCVDTREGHGVLHMIWAWRDPNPDKRASFYVPFQWLQGQWRDIHGAFHVNVKRIGGADLDARRLSRYLVAQYCGDQDGLVRLSQSRMEVSLTRMRQALLRALRDSSERYRYAANLPATTSLDDFSKRFNAMFWSTFRVAWDELVRTRSCEAFGVRFVWFANKLDRV